MKQTDTGKIKVLLVDDHKLLRQGLESMLNGFEDIEIVGSLSNGEDAISEFPSLEPDVILMDIMMMGMTGIEATRWIKEQNSKIRIILISSEIKKELVTAGIQVGIDGYLPKDVGKETLIEAIRSVMKGNRFFNEAITSLVFEDFYSKNKGVPAKRTLKIVNDLTTREHEVLALVASGKGNKQVAEELFISVKTVETHKSHILEKLNLRNTAELVMYAVKNKLIELE
jgi:DNA-binding NarL/FixJ family response regulator